MTSENICYTIINEETGEICGHEEEAHFEDNTLECLGGINCPCKKFQAVCKHEYKEDERFKGDGIIMLFGNIGDVKREVRVICDKCGNVDYLKISKVRKTRKEKLK